MNFFVASTTNLVNKDPIKPITVSNSPSTTSNPPTPIVETPPTPEIPSTTLKTEPLPRRIAIPTENEQTESTIRNVIAPSSEDTKTQSRVVGNRNVVIAETTSVPNRTVVQRVVVSSNSSKANDDDSDIDLDDLMEQENDTKKSN